MFKKVLVANRGEIACRVFRTLRRMGIQGVAVYSEVDRHSRHVLEADEAVCLGGALASESYLNVEAILEAVRKTGAEAIHPGYGFLSENPDFVERCEGEGIVFIGPSAEQMRLFGLKHSARKLAQEAGVPLCPGTELIESLEEAQKQADEIGYPVMVKSTAGGGGIGMRMCRSEEELDEAFLAVKHLGESHFKNTGVFLERYVESARHLEVQIFGNGRGGVISLGVRDCSCQRRNQKVIEETPAPRLGREVEEALTQAAMRLAEGVSYASAGTVEFIYDAERGEFYFLEVNTRLQVEHGVTEEVYGVDLVEWMVRQAAGAFGLDSEEWKGMQKGLESEGHSIQVRVYAEDPGKGFQPSSGLVSRARFPEDVRVETWVEDGTEVSPYYDPLVVKLIATAEGRDEALAKMVKALEESEVYGIETNQEYLRQILRSDTAREGKITTGFLNEFSYKSSAIEVVVPGMQSLVVDYPGRQGYWSVGVPPSGPMDDLAFRQGNAILGNDEGAAGLELTAKGPTLKFHGDGVMAIMGARMPALLDGVAVEYGEAVEVKAGSRLKMGSVKGGGFRTYLCFQGGLDVPEYLGSRTTFQLGKFGGHSGRALRGGDVLHLLPEVKGGEVNGGVEILEYGNEWEVGVLYGPHGAPDFFTEEDISTFFSAEWKVHHHSDRTGIRLIGPKPKWARSDGGEAGLHPSNIHDNAYAVGAIDFTGDMPIILGQDGPSLGGFVCPAVVVQDELWKLGQLKAGDVVRFKRLGVEAVYAEKGEEDKSVFRLDDAVLHELSGEEYEVDVTYRGQGDRYVLVEYGELKLDLNLRFRAHALMDWLEGQEVEGVIDLTPGIRSLQVQFDPRVLKLERLMKILVEGEEELPAISEMEVPARIVHLPLSWDDPSTQEAIEKYERTVRPGAPWCPSNIEFIRRINGLESIQDVYDIVFGASYLVMGLGDVYLGAPVATPLDPRHRLVTTKYNPARTWTPENAVGIGGAYLCVYGMEGPGGYQFVGRTIQMWNRYRSGGVFEKGKPWLLRFFDQIRFYPVSSDELAVMRDDFLHGRFELKVEETVFRLADYQAFLEREKESIGKFKEGQEAAFQAERERWVETGQASFEVSEEAFDEGEVGAGGDDDVPEGCEAVVSDVSGCVWKVEVSVGDEVKEGDVLVVVEAMKMETYVVATESGRVKEILCEEGKPVGAGQLLVILDSL